MSSQFPFLLQFWIGSALGEAALRASTIFCYLIGDNGEKDPEIYRMIRILPEKQQGNGRRSYFYPFLFKVKSGIQ